MACFDRALELDPRYQPALLNRHVMAQMREGEPFIPEAVQEVQFYADRLRNQPGHGAVQTPREFDGGFVRARVEQPMGAARCADCIEQTS